MLMLVRGWGVHVRLMTTRMMFTCVRGPCERSAFARAVYFL
jgi:hypothetical protein